MKQDIFDTIKKIENDYNVNIIYCIKSGSQLHGTNTPVSDTDYTGIYVPSIKDIVLKRDLHQIKLTTGNNNSKNTKNDIDISLYSIENFLSLIKKGETNTLDILHSFNAKYFKDICIINKSEYTHFLSDNIDKLCSKQLHAFISYCQTQADKFNVRGVRYCELKDFIAFYCTQKRMNSESCVSVNLEDIQQYAELKKTKFINIIEALGANNRFEKYVQVLGKKYRINLSERYFCEQIQTLFSIFGSRVKMVETGTDFKALAHSVRIVQECKELITTGKITFPLPNADYIKTIKAGLFDADEVMKMIEDSINFVNNNISKSKLNDFVSEDLVNKIIDKIVMKSHKELYLIN